MYNEIWESVEALLKPVNSMANLITIPELTFDLINTLRLNINDFDYAAEYADSSKYKRVIKQQMTDPSYQLLNIVFDYEKEDAVVKSMKIVYEGKLTMVTIVPYRYITKEYTIDGPLPGFMLNYLLSARTLLIPILHSPFASANGVIGNNLLSAISLHSIPLLYTKWMTSVFGVSNEVTGKIIEMFEKIGYPAVFTGNNIATYIEFLRSSTIEKLLDYSFIATEDSIIVDAYTSYTEKEKANSQENEGEKNAENISAD